MVVERNNKSKYLGDKIYNAHPICRSAPIQYDADTVISVYTETNHIILFHYF